MGALKREKPRKRGKGRVRAWWRNASLKLCFMAYMLLFLSLATVLCVLSLVVLNDIEQNVVLRKLESLSLAEEPIGYYAADDVLVIYGAMVYDPESGLYEPYETISERYPFTEREAAILSATGIGEMLCIPVCLFTCIAAAGLLFYRNRLKRPIEHLSAAYAKVAAGDLDFELPIERNDELGRLCGGFEAMRRALMDNNRCMWRAMEERRRLNAAFSHDLRTPLTVLGGHTEMLRKYDYPPEKRAETLATMAAHIERMERYVADMSALQKLEDIEPRREAVSLAELTRRMAESARILCAERELQFENDSELTGQVMADAQVMQQVFDNLTANAVRFAQGRVSARFERCDAAFAFTLWNDGAAFTPEQLKRAPDPYYTTGGEDGRHFGLGLCIARILCEKHGGALMLFNPPEGGASVTATFHCPDACN